MILRYQKITITIILILILILLTGCWDRNDPENTAIVTGGGMDYNPETEMYKLIFQIISPLTMQGKGGMSDKPNFWTVSAWGHTFYDALTNLEKKVSRKIIFSHAHIYVISERMAKTAGILPVINGISRSRQSRLLLIPIICESDPQKILSTMIPLESSNARGIENQILQTSREISGATDINARVFANLLSSPGQEAFAVGIKYIGDSSNEKSETGPDTKPPIKITGKYAFRGDKLAGLLNDRETRGCNWIRGKARNATLLLKYPGKENVFVNIIANQQKAEIIPFIKNGNPAIKLKIKAEGRLINITGVSSIKEQSKITGSLKRRMAEVIRNDIKLSIKRCQTLKSDVFGFGNAFYRLKYDKWLEMKDNWVDIFAGIPVEIEVKTDIKRMGMINKGINPQ